MRNRFILFYRNSQQFLEKVKCSTCGIQSKLQVNNSRKFMRRKYRVMPYLEKDWRKQSICIDASSFREKGIGLLLFMLLRQGQLEEHKDHQTVPNLSFAKYSFITSIITNICKFKPFTIRDLYSLYNFFLPMNSRTCLQREIKVE